MSLDPKAKEWSFLSRSNCLKFSQISLPMAESHVISLYVNKVIKLILLVCYSISDFRLQIADLNQTPFL